MMSLVILGQTQMTDKAIILFCRDSETYHYLPGGQYNYNPSNNTLCLNMSNCQNDIKNHGTGAKRIFSPNDITSAHVHSIDGLTILTNPDWQYSSVLEHGDGEITIDIMFGKVKYHITASIADHLTDFFKLQPNLICYELLNISL